MAQDGARGGADWNDGYVTDVAYTHSVHLEATPAWIDAATVLLGHRPRKLAAPFRYADLGCGQGLTVLCVAAASPAAEVWGFDFNPAHIEFARGMARDAGLTNAHFEEISFKDLARRSETANADFDYIVAHGVLSWISLENRGHLTNIIGRLLRPGGMAYVSYNVTTGWSGVEPIRHLMRQYALSSPLRSDQAVAEVFQLLDTLKTGGATIFQNYPGLSNRLDKMKELDTRYVAHEMLNRDWHPLMFSEVQEAMAETRTTYIGSATLTENIDSVSLQADILPMFRATASPAIRETIRDLASSKTFRRDLWRKGAEPLTAPEHRALVDEMTLVWTGKMPAAEIVFPSVSGTVIGQPALYGPLLDAIRAGPVTIGDLRARTVFEGREIGEFVEAASFLFSGEYAFPALSGGGGTAAREAARRLNGAIIGRLKLGLPMRRLAAPLVGSCVGIDILEGLIAGKWLDGEPDERTISQAEMIETIRLELVSLGGMLHKDGRKVEDASEARLMVSDAIGGVLRNRLAHLRMMGVVA